MTVLDVLNSPWAILPTKLEEIQAIYCARVRGEDVDLQAIEARLGRPMVNEQQAYEVVSGTALIPLRGVLGQRMNLMSNMSGGTSTEMFAADVRSAAADPAVQSIIILADTPGGTVAGTQAAASAVRAVRGIKPIATLVQGAMASAGVWIGSASDLVALDSQTSQIGSIGVVATHVDVSQREKDMGIKTTEIVAGKYKRAASQFGPLTETGQAMMQAQVDYLYSLFVADIAAYRGTTEADVLQRMADGRMFIGQQAIDAGLADQITSLEKLISQLANAQSNRRTLSLAKSSMESHASSPNPQQLASQWSAEHPEAAAVLRAEGAVSERDRIAAVRAQSLPGHEALIERFATDGHTTGPEAAVAVLAAERQAQANSAAVRLAEAPAPVPYASAPDAGLESVKPTKPEPTAQELAARAREITDQARTAGRTISATDAVAQARRELTT
jgi:signal peptide peptidase SppA